jgi:hypothetical protein
VGESLVRGAQSLHARSLPTASRADKKI